MKSRPSPHVVFTVCLCGQIVLACLGTYAVLITIARSGGDDEPAAVAAAPAAAPAASDGAIPSIADANFDEWIKVGLLFARSQCVVETGLRWAALQLVMRG